MKSYYDLLEVAPTATAEEIKHAFRQQIARYHPDKVQHLGAEFREMAAVRAAELTRAYRTLTDPRLRAEYDVQAGFPAAAGSVPPPPPRPAPVSPTVRVPDAPSPDAAAAAPQTGGSTGFDEDRAGRDALLRRAAVARFRQALEGEFGRFHSMPVPGFEIACTPKPTRFSFKSSLRVLGRFVPRVDAAAVGEAWALAAKAPGDSARELIVFLMGPELASASELAAAIAGQRRRPGTPGGKALVLVPVNTSTWSAHVPTDAPPAVRAVLARLQSA